jgi:hypothetical protein
VTFCDLIELQLPKQLTMSPESHHESHEKTPDQEDIAKPERDLTLTNKVYFGWAVKGLLKEKQLSATNESKAANLSLMRFLLLTLVKQLLKGINLFFLAAIVTDIFIL